MDNDGYNSSPEKKFSLKQEAVGSPSNEQESTEDAYEQYQPNGEYPEEPGSPEGGTESTESNDGYNDIKPNIRVKTEQNEGEAYEEEEEPVEDHADYAEQEDFMEELDDTHNNEQEGQQDEAYQEEESREEPEERQEEEGRDEGDVEDESGVSPKKKRVVLSSDEESDDDVPDNSNARSRSGSPKDEENNSSKPKRILGSDFEDSDDNGSKKGDEDDEEGEGGEKVGELMAHIFGDESDEEKEEGTKAVDDDDDDGDARPSARHARDSGDEDGGFEWDFDVMLAQKKAEKSKKRRRRKDGGIDIINDDDGTIQMLVEQMKAAATADRNSNMNRKPALKKRKMLAVVKSFLLRAPMMEAMIDGGIMSAISEWLAPLPDKSLPALEIRTSLLTILQGYGRLEQSILKQSGLGKAIMLLFKHPKETKENKRMAHKLISEWARPIFQLETDYRSMSRDDRLQRDLDLQPAVKKRRDSQDAGTSEEVLQPGMKGFIGRARVPKPSTRDYVQRPKSLIEGEFKGPTKGKAFARLDRATRDFKERTKKTQAKRAIGVSIEGRNMSI